MNAPIPKGWRLMLPDEVMTTRDKCQSIHRDEWEQVSGISGATPHRWLGKYICIRKDNKPAPVEEKIWLNLWD